MARMVAVIHATPAETAVELRVMKRSIHKGWILLGRVWVGLGREGQQKFIPQILESYAGEAIREAAAEFVSSGASWASSWHVAAYRFHNRRLVETSSKVIDFRQVIRITVESRPAAGCPAIIGVVNVEIKISDAEHLSFQQLEPSQALTFQRVAEVESVLCVTPTEIQENAAKSKTAFVETLGQAVQP